MSQSDPGDTTDSTSGSGSTSDWALVDEYGMLQDNDTESTGSSVEVMDGEDEEDADPITPLAGNSPPGNTLQPRFVLRLSSHEVSDTDEEAGVGTSEIATDSSMSDIISLTSSDMPVSSQDSLQNGTQDLLQTGNQDSLQAGTQDILQTGIQDTLQTGTQDSLQAGTQDTETKSTTQPVAVSQGQQISPEHIESLRRAIDDVQSNLLQSHSASSSLSSFEMFGVGKQDSGCSLTSSGVVDTEVTPPTSLPPSGQLQDTASKVDQCKHDRSQNDAGVTSLECVNQGVIVGLDDSSSMEQSEGTVECVQNPRSNAVETLGPDLPDMRPLMQRMVLRQERGTWVDWWCRFLDEHWFLSSYVLFLSVVVLVTGFNVYFAFSSIDVVNPFVDKTSFHRHAGYMCVSEDDMQTALENHRQELREQKNVVKGLHADLAERNKKFQIVTLHKDSVLEENANLNNQIKALQEELLSCRGQASADDTGIKVGLAEELPSYGGQNPQDESGSLMKSSGSAVLSQTVPSREPVDETGRQTSGKSKEILAEMDSTGNALIQEDLEKDLERTKTEREEIRNIATENRERLERKRNQKIKQENEKIKQENEKLKQGNEEIKQKNKKINQENGKRKQARKEEDNTRQENNERNLNKKKEKRRNEQKQAEEEEYESDNAGSVWMNNIFDIMNKTKGQIEETWHQVRNISDHLWRKHSPTLEKMHNKFQKKFEHLSNKFQEKLMEKTSKWFGKWKRSCNKDKKEENASAKTETKRRPFKHEEPSVKQGATKENKKADFGGNSAGHTRCDHRLMDLSTRIKMLSVSKLERKSAKHQSQLVTEMRNSLAALLQGDTIHDIDVQREWLKCQATWWQDSDDLTVGPGCERYLSCWQVKLAGGDAKDCRRIKLEEGNVLDNRCAVGPGPEDYKQTDLDHGSGSEQVKEDHYDDDDDDDNDIDDNDDLWYLGRAEDRKYHHDEPDDWFFRRAKDHLYAHSEDEDENYTF